jgi:8-oxo-dGTP diphosphatase
MKEILNQHFGGRPRIRACGLLVEQGKVLLIAHDGLREQGLLWLPPGGGVKYGERLEDALTREFKEETGLEIEVGDFLLVHEFIRAPLHAVEVFFYVHIKSGGLKLGKDPELPSQSQIMKAIQWMGEEDIKEIPNELIHRLFREIKQPEQLVQLKGSFILSN